MSVSLPRMVGGFLGCLGLQGSAGTVLRYKSGDYEERLDRRNVVVVMYGSFHILSINFFFRGDSLMYIIPLDVSLRYTYTNIRLC